MPQAAAPAKATAQTMARSTVSPAGKAPPAPRTPDAADAAAKNKPLMEDIRLLGRILGDVIREQEGKFRHGGLQIGN